MPQFQSMACSHLRHEPPRRPKLTMTTRGRLCGSTTTTPHTFRRRGSQTQRRGRWTRSPREVGKKTTNLHRHSPRDAAPLHLPLPLAAGLCTQAAVRTVASRARKGGTQERARPRSRPPPCQGPRGGPMKGDRARCPCRSPRVRPAVGRQTMPFPQPQPRPRPLLPHCPFLRRRHRRGIAPTRPNRRDVGRVPLLRPESAPGLRGGRSRGRNAPSARS